MTAGSKAEKQATKASLAGNAAGRPRLWTPIASAIDAYRRRLIVHPEAHYEHLWRLVHVQEALIVTLGALTATRILNLRTGTSEEDRRFRNRVRYPLTGEKPSDQGDAEEMASTEAPCLSGSIASWIAYLKRSTSWAADCPSSGFLEGVGAFLGRKDLGRLRVAEGWRVVAEVPEQYDKESLELVDRLAAINSLRNKLAHVPFPTNAIETLHWQMRQEVFGMLLKKYRDKEDSPSSDLPSHDWSEVLLGTIRMRRGWTSGAAEFGLLSRSDKTDERAFALFSRNGGGEEDWPLTPLLRVGHDLKSSLMFNLDLDALEEIRTTDDITAEYHRFGAEAAPHEKVELSATDVSVLLQENRPIETSVSEEPPPEVSGDSGPSNEIVPSPIGDAHVETAEAAAPKTAEEVQEESIWALRQNALDAFRRKDYGIALQNFERLSTSGNPNAYNDIVKSRHAGALWRTAVLGEKLDPGAQDIMLSRSAQLLEEASQKQDPSYRARTLYELSKVLWYRANLSAEKKELLERALARASEAATISNEWSFITWYEKVQKDLSLLSENTLASSQQDASGEGTGE